MAKRMLRALRAAKPTIEGAEEVAELVAGAAPPGVNPAEIKRVEAPSFSASQLHLQGTGTDFVLLFQQAHPATLGDQLAPFAVVDPVVVVHVSPQMLKDISLISAKAVADFESQHGAISSPYALKIAAETAKAAASPQRKRAKSVH